MDSEKGTSSERGSGNGGYGSAGGNSNSGGRDDMGGFDPANSVSPAESNAGISGVGGPGGGGSTTSDFGARGEGRDPGASIDFIDRALEYFNPKAMLNRQLDPFMNPVPTADNPGIFAGMPVVGAGIALSGLIEAITGIKGTPQAEMDARGEGRASPIQRERDYTEQALASSTPNPFDEFQKRVDDIVANAVSNFDFAAMPRFEILPSLQTLTRPSQPEQPKSTKKA